MSRSLFPVRVTLQRALSLMVGLFMGTVLLGCSTENQTVQTGAATDSAPPKVIRVGYVRWGLLPILRERGTLEKELAEQNIQVEWVGPFPAFAPVLEAINAGEVDLSAGGDIPGISGLVGGTPICLLGYQEAIPEAEAILVRNDSSIQSLQDLVGKKVAVNRGGWGEHLLLRSLAEANIPKEQVERVYLGPTDALPAVTQGHVDAWSVWEPNVSIAEAEHGLRAIASGEAASHYGLYVVHKQALAENASAIGAALEVIEHEAEWGATNRQEAAETFGEAVDLAPEVVEKMAQRRQVEKLLPLTPQVIADLQRRADWMVEQQAIPERVDLSESVCPATAELEKYTAAVQPN